MDDNRALVIIGGITGQKLYAFEDWWNILSQPEKAAYKIIRNPGGYNQPQTAIAFAAYSRNVKYNCVIEIDCEQHFTSWIDGIDDLPIIGNYIDRGRDIRQAYTSFKIQPGWPPIIRKITYIRNYVSDYIKYLQNQGYIVDGWGHSLGALIMAGSNAEVDTLSLAGCPLTMQNDFCRRWTEQTFKKEQYSIKAKLLNYFYSENDIVCNKPLGENLALMISPECHHFATTTGHSHHGYIKKAKLEKII